MLSSGLTVSLRALITEIFPAQHTRKLWMTWKHRSVHADIPRQELDWFHLCCVTFGELCLHFSGLQKKTVPPP